MKLSSDQSSKRQCLRLALTLVIGVTLLAGCRSVSQETGNTSAAEVDRLRQARDRAESGEARLSPIEPILTEALDPDAPEPAWVTRGQSTRYPLTRYIVGVGSSSTTDASSHAAMRIAEDRARNAIAKQIKVRIRSEFESAAKIVTKTQGDKTRVETNQSSVADRINSQADLQLEGAEIVSRWYDKTNKTTWAFAALDRSITAAGILDRMTALRERMAEDHQLGTTLRNEARMYQALRHFRKALDASLGLLNYRAQLRVISPSAAEAAAGQPELTENFAALWKDIAETTQALRVGMTIFADVDDQATTSADAETQLSAALQSMGLNLSTPPAILAEISYATLKEMSPIQIRQLAGDEFNCLLLARVSARHHASEPMVNLTMHFYHARAALLFIDLDAETIAASVGFDYAPATYSGNKDRARAAEGALSKAARELSARLKLTLENQN